MSVLLIDPDVNFRRALAIALRLDGVRAYEAKGPADAERLLGEVEPDVVHFHLLPPEMGTGFLDFLRERLPSCLVVVSTPWQEILDGARPHLGEGVVEMLRPFSPTALLDQIRNANCSRLP